MPYFIALQTQPLEPIQAIDCMPPPALPCVVNLPAPTQVGNSLAQEVVLQSTIPADYNAVSVWWRALTQNLNGDYEEVWKYESTAEASAGPGGIVTFGAPGLEKGRNYKFEVGFCRVIPNTTSKGCTCWSQDLDTSTAATFSTMSPNAPPSPTLVQRYEDNFNRPNTAAKSTQGDGLGPLQGWRDDWSSLGGPSILGNSALFPNNGFATLTRGARDQHSYAAVKFWMNQASSPANYNLDLIARYVDGISPTFLFAKLVFTQLGFTSRPGLVLGNESTVIDRTLLSKNVDYIELGDPTITPFPYPGHNGAIEQKCWTAPDLSGTDRSLNSVWLQLETFDVSTTGVGLLGVVAWNCPTASEETPKSVWDCANYCYLYKVDNDLSRQLISGTWGIFSHHIGHRVEIFRAGDAAAN